MVDCETVPKQKRSCRQEDAVLWLQSALNLKALSPAAHSKCNFLHRHLLLPWVQIWWSFHHIFWTLGITIDRKISHSNACLPRLISDEPWVHQARPYLKVSMGRGDGPDRVMHHWPTGQWLCRGSRNLWLSLVLSGPTTLVTVGRPAEEQRAIVGPNTEQQSSWVHGQLGALGP